MTEKSVTIREGQLFLAACGRAVISDSLRFDFNFPLCQNILGQDTEPQVAHYYCVSVWEGGRFNACGWVNVTCGVKGFMWRAYTEKCFQIVIVANANANSELSNIT